MECQINTNKSILKTLVRVDFIIGGWAFRSFTKNLLIKNRRGFVNSLSESAKIVSFYLKSVKRLHLKRKESGAYSDKNVGRAEPT